MVSDDLCEVIITAPDSNWLADFTARLLDDPLARRRPSGHAHPVHLPMARTRLVSWPTRSGALSRLSLSAAVCWHDLLRARRPRLRSRRRCGWHDGLHDGLPQA